MRFIKYALIVLVFFWPGASVSGEKMDFEPYFEMLEKALSLKQEEYDRIWPGYNLNDFPIGLFNENEAYLINHPNPGKLFKDTGKKILNYCLYQSPQKISEFIGNTSVEYNGHQTSIFRIEKKMKPGDFHNLLFHEVFHSFQKRTDVLKDRYGNILLQPFFPIDDLEYYALFYVEQMILKDALLSEDLDKTEEKICKYYAVLERRTGKTAKDFVDFESGVHINEGTATYAGHKGMELMDLKHAARERLLKLLAFKTVEPTGFRRGFYAPGRIVTELLDRFDARWKGSLEKGFNLLDTLKERVRPDRNLSLNRILEEYAWTKIKAEFKKRLDEQSLKREEIKNSILKAGYVEIQFPDSNFLNAGSIRFDPMNISLVSENLLCHKRILIIGREGRLDFRSEGQPVINEILPGNLFKVLKIFFAIPRDAKVLIDSEEVPILPQQGTVQEFAVVSKTLNLKLKKARIMKRNDGSCVVSAEKGP